MVRFSVQVGASGLQEQSASYQEIQSIAVEDTNLGIPEFFLKALPPSRESCIPQTVFSGGKKLLLEWSKDKNTMVKSTTEAEGEIKTYGPLLASTQSKAIYTVRSHKANK